MNRNNNIFNKNEIENKLKNFKEGQDYSVLRENDKKTYNFRNIVLSEIFKRDYITVYEVAENWDSDNFNYHREAAEYAGKNGSKVTYSYEHRINKNGDYYSEWSGKYQPWDRDEKHSWTLRALEPKKIEPNFDENEIAMHEKYLAEFQEKKHFYEMRLIEEKECSHGDYPKRAEVMEGIRKSIEEFATKINYEKDWLTKNSNFGSKPAVCCNCGFKVIRLSDKYCESCGAELGDKAKSVKSDLVQENHELRHQLTEVQKQLAEVLAELKKLKSNINGQDSEKLNQQIAHNERLIKNGENISVNEVQEQVQKSQALMKEFNTTIAPTKDNKVQYVIGGSVLVVLMVIIGYFLVKKHKRK